MSEKNKHTSDEYAQNSADKTAPRGFFVLADDLDLEEIRKEIAADFEKSLVKTAREL